MAVDKLVDSAQLDADLTSVANAIRAKSGGSSQLAFPSGFVNEIGNISTGGGTTAIIDSNTEYIDITGFGQLSTDRMFSYNPAKVIVLRGYTRIASSYFFEFGTNLLAVILPDVTSIAGYAFWQTNPSKPKTAVDIYKKNTFPSSVPFRLDQGGDIILRANEMSTTGFTASTWGVSSGLKFYVPSALRNDYLADTNWNTFGSDRILTIEGSAYESTDWWEALI